MITPYTDRPENPGDVDLLSPEEYESLSIYSYNRDTSEGTAIISRYAPDDETEDLDYRDLTCSCGLPEHVCAFLDSGVHEEYRDEPEDPQDMPALDSNEELADEHDEALRFEAGDLKYRREIGD